MEIEQNDFTLLDNDKINLIRRGRFIIASFRKKHLTHTTCPVQGGMNDQLQNFVNFQSCEGAGHIQKAHEIHKLGRKGYHDKVCREINLDPNKTATMGTAASMQYASIKTETFRDDEVTAVVTAGVHGNAARAGDPASWYECEGEMTKISETVGTINTMLFLSQPLSEGALCKVPIIVTEAKVAALDELSVSSRYSCGKATGTGTDQLCIAANLESSLEKRHYVGHHVKLGELIGQAVLNATKEALRWQNGLEQSLTRHFFHALERHGLKEKNIEIELKKLFNAETFELYKKNTKSIYYDPQLSSCAYGISEVLDRIRFQCLPNDAGREAILNLSALLATTLSTHHEKYCFFRKELSKQTLHDSSRMIIQAIALGWQHKW